MPRIINEPEELIFSTARKLAQQEGLAQINMRKIATECEIAIGTIYNYFPTKMDLIIKLIEDFWDECFKGFYSIHSQDADFFVYLSDLYFYVLKFLENFKNNWLEDLAALPIACRIKGKQREEIYITHFIEVLVTLLEAHKHQFNEVAYVTLDPYQFARFIQTHFMAMLRKKEHNYIFFEDLLKRILLK